MLLLLLFTVPVVAQDDTARHRQVYEAINTAIGKAKPVLATFRDEPLEFALQGWFLDGKLARIDARVEGEDGDGSEEIYLENGKMLFVYRSYLIHDRDHPKVQVKVEDRFYFTAGKLTKWIGADKKPVPVNSEDFTAEAERLAGNFPHFVAAFKGKEPPVDKAVRQLKDGVFLGLEIGDYTHWNLRTTDGQAISYYVLRPDAALQKVLDDPKPFIGKRCRVRWKHSVEDIPEAGGKVEVDQLLSVEWLGKK